MSDTKPLPNSGETSPSPTIGYQTDVSPGDSAVASHPDRIGLYHILEILGEGGMGVVYLAEQKEPVRRRVALKLIKLGMDTKEVIARFESERQALALMSHPHVAGVLDAGATEHGRPYFVMEYVPGIPITDYCDRNRMGVRERLELFTHVCEAVQHAHQKGIIHRDLKPSNVLVMLQDGRPLPKVIDFGVAKATGGRLTERTIYTEQGRLIGTPAYMSPEQAEMTVLDIDTRTDVYALGVLLYELLTGALPFDPKSLREAGYAQMQRIICEQEPSKPSTRVSELAQSSSRDAPHMADGTRSVPATSSSAGEIAAHRNTEPHALIRQLRGDLDWICLKALEKDRTRRYGTALELAADIQRHMVHEPVRACPPSLSYRLMKFVRKYRGPLSAAAAVLVALVVGLVATTMLYFQAKTAQKAEAGQRAEVERQKGRVEGQRDRAVTAEQQAKSEEQKAKRSQSDTQAFSDFLVHDVLAVARPEGVQGGLGVDVTVVQALETAEAKLEERFAGRPIAEATARDAIGKTWRNLAKYEQAERHLRRAVELRERELGPDDPATLDSSNSLGVLLFQMGRFEDAVALQEPTLDKWKAKLGLDHPRTLSSMNNLASAYKAAGMFDKALPLYEETVERQKSKLGPDHLGTLTSMSNLALLYKDLGKFDQALPLLEKTLEKRKLKLGADHPETLNSMHNMALAYQHAGKLDQAIPLLERTVEKRKLKLGPDHPETLSSMGSLAFTYYHAGRLDQALTLFEETLDRQKAKLGPNHPDTLTNLSNLALAYNAAGKIDRALPLFEETLEKFKATLGSDHPDTLTSMFNLASAYMAYGRMNQAFPLFEETLEKRKSKFGPDHPHTLAAEIRLVACHVVSQRHEEAIRMGETLLPKANSMLGPDHPDHVELLSWLSQVYTSVKRYDKLQEVSRASLDRERRRRPPNNAELSRALASHGLALIQTGQSAEAEPLLRECLTIREQILPDDWKTFNAQSLLGGSLLGQAHALLATDRTAAAEKFAAAEALLLAGYAGLESRTDKIPTEFRTRNLTDAVERLVDLYTAWDKPDHVAQWRAKLLPEPAVNSENK